MEGALLHGALLRGPGRTIRLGRAIGQGRPLVVGRKAFHLMAIVLHGMKYNGSMAGV